MVSLTSTIQINPIQLNYIKEMSSSGRHYFLWAPVIALVTGWPDLSFILVAVGDDLFISSNWMATFFFSPPCFAGEDAWSDGLGVWGGDGLSFPIECQKPQL